MATKNNGVSLKGYVNVDFHILLKVSSPKRHPVQNTSEIVYPVTRLKNLKMESTSAQKLCTRII